MRSDMPNRIYRGSYPPRRIDHVLAHPYEVLMAAAGLLACAALLAAELGAPITISPTMRDLPSTVAWLVGASGVVGNALVIAGVFDDGEDLMRGWMIERVGLIAAITSWGAYSLAVATTHPGAAISYSVTLFIAGANAVRLVATLREESTTRTAIRTHGDL